MPYSKVSDLPPAVKDNLPAAAARVFLQVVNAEMKKGKSDSMAFRMAWGAIKQNWEKNSDGEWVKKLDDQLTVTSSVAKVDEERRLVSGWISIVHDGEKPVEDRQGDVIDIDDLRKALHEFVKVRIGKAMHDGDPVSDLVELVIVDDDFRKALGAPAGPTGAWAVWKVNDDAVWARVKSGELAAFSIGGRGKRRDV